MRYHLSIIITLAAGLVAAAPAPGKVTDERQVLVDFYHSTNGEGWHDNGEGLFFNDEWLSQTDHCTWYGITCKNGVVTSIHLSQNNLSGRLLPALFDLPHLSHLDLSDNHLHGRLPGKVINSLPRLDSLSGNDRVTIDLSGNRLSGKLPEFTRQQGPGALILRLADNALTGPIPASWVDMELLSVDLNDNAIDMPLVDVWRALPTVANLQLAGTGLSGPFPDSPARFDGDQMLVDRLGRLNLSRNQLEGELPAWLAELGLWNLNLQHNRLSGTIAVAVEALGTGGSLILSHNMFSGPIPEELSSLSIRRLDEQSRAGRWPHLIPLTEPPALDLCWNDFDPPGAELLDFINARHHGGSFANCQRPRVPISPAISGSWFNPTRSGEGFVQHLLDNGQVLLFWFTFSGYGPHWEEGQTWYLNVVSPQERSLWLQDLLKPNGSFNAGSTGFLRLPFWLSIDPLSDSAQQISYSHPTIIWANMTGWVWMNFSSDRREQIALTKLAGSRCDNRQPHQWISGAWYDPARASEGFVIEVNQDGRVLVYWFTYQPKGGQAWMIGTGEFNNGRVIVDEMIQPVGTRFGPGFDSGEIEYIDWGSLSIEFDGEDSGHVEYESNFEEYGSGNYPIERLARPMLAECEQGENR